MTQINGTLLALLAITMFALVTPMAKKVGLFLTPLSMTFIFSIFLFCFAGLGILFFEKQSAIFKLSLQNWLIIFAYSVLNFTAYYVFLHALKTVKISQYQIIEMLTTLIGALGAFLLLGETITVKMIIGYAIACLGVFVAVSG